jgi:hypothetical protein
MRFALCTMLLLVTPLALPVGADARPLDLLRGAKLEAATGKLTIAESRCPQGSNNCGKVTLAEDFKAGPKPRTRATEGREGFTAGLRISGAGTGQCTSESPTTTQAGPDGSVQFLGSSARVVPAKFATTRVAAAGGNRSIRIAWLEPIAPGVTCDYFGESGTALAVPVGGSLQSSLISPPVPARVLKRSRFSVTIAGSQEWNDAASDGTQIAGRASWRLRLDYKR